MGAGGLPLGQLFALVGNLVQEPVQFANDVGHISTFLYADDKNTCGEQFY